MKTRFAIALALCLMAAPAFAQKVFIDYDQKYDLESIETWAWYFSKDHRVEDQLQEERLKQAIEYHLSLGGARQVEENPDVWVTFHGSTKEQVNINTTSMGYGYGPGWYGGGYGGYYGGGMGGSTSTVSTYEIGTLVIDVWDADTKDLVWRGTATATISSNPEKMAKLIQNAVNKLAKKWDNIRKKAAKDKEKAAAKAAGD